MSIGRAFGHRSGPSTPLPKENSALAFVLPETSINPFLMLLAAAARPQIEFTEWTPDRHLRHSRFVGLRKDKVAREVVR
jgi:ATP-dependent DNA ligase